MHVSKCIDGNNDYMYMKMHTLLDMLLQHAPEQVFRLQFVSNLVWWNLYIRKLIKYHLKDILHVSKG